MSKFTSTSSEENVPVEIKIGDVFISRVAAFVPKGLRQGNAKVVKHDGYAVSNSGDYIDGSKPPLWKTPTSRAISWSDAPANDPDYDFITYALQAAETIPESCIVTRRNCMRKFYKVFCNLNCDDFVILITKRGQRLFFDRTESHASTENFGKPFERLCTAASKNLGSYHCINEFANFVGEIPLIVISETDAIDGDNNLELKTKYNKPGKNGRQYAMTKATIKDQAYYNDEFKDHCAQMFFGNVVALKMGIIEGADKKNARVAAIETWTFQEVKDKAFGSTQSFNVALDKIASVLEWIRNKLTTVHDLTAELVYVSSTSSFTLRVSTITEEFKTKTAEELELSLDSLSLNGGKKA